MCKKRLEQLIAYRSSAIQHAFGDPFALPEQIGIEFIYGDDPQYGYLKGRIGYDAERNVLIVSRVFLSTEHPNPLQQAQDYWPFYLDGSYREKYRVIGAIDNALWTAYLQESAQRHGLTWPHADCASTDVERRLPCEMVMSGIAEHLTAVRLPLFNENRLDRIWPDDFAQFATTVWLQDSKYEDVRRYGGILLMKPLVAQFGILPALAYVAQTPFEVHEWSLRAAALRYQREARIALAAQASRQLAESMAAVRELLIRRDVACFSTPQRRC